MTLRALGYVVARSDDLDGWHRFGTELLGLQPAERSRSSLAFRMDERRARVLAVEASGGGLAAIGWEVDDQDALDALAARLDGAGVAVTPLTADEADLRGVSAGIRCSDPAGNAVEVFHGAVTADLPFVPGRAIAGFRTGPLGLGHVVLTVDRLDAVMPFYVELLGFHLTDYVLAPFRAYFFHLNARHHSLALIETGTDGVHHLMLETAMLDDVGQGYDLALGEQGRVATTLGRHINDLVTSFYAHGPSGFLVEYGWGGRVLDPAWQAIEVTEGPSLWGHERDWLDDAGRAEARAMRLAAAANGTRAPLQVMDGNYEPAPGTSRGWAPKKRE